MKKTSIRPTPESHFALGFLTIPTLFLGLTGIIRCENHIPVTHYSDILRPNNEVTTESGTRYMVFPPTTRPVRLYLIDSGISHKLEWFSSNPNLKFEASYSSVPSSTSTLHGSRMLDIIAGPHSGALSGTPLQVVSMNIYQADNLSTTSGIVADAILEAVDLEERSGTPHIPAVICLASGASVSGSSSILEYAVDRAVEAGITVIVSAGNLGQDASKFIPSKYGTKQGVICVGAYGKNHQPLPMSNTGPAVDLMAPGECVRTLALPSPTPGTCQGMTGTSPAAAIATAAAIHHLSKTPDLSPAELEELLGSSIAVPAPDSLERTITSVGGEKFLDVSFVSGQLLSGNAMNGFSADSGWSVGIEWSADLSQWNTGRFTDVGQPVEVPGGWRYTARSKTPVLSRNRLADLTILESTPRLITSVKINDTSVSLPRAPYQLPLQAALLQQDLRAAGFPGTVVASSGAGYRIDVPDVLYTTPHPGSWVTWPPYITGYDPLSGEPMISGGISFTGSYHLPDGTPVDLPVQMARLRTEGP